MLSRADFVFTIGYDGPSAVVDGQAKKHYGSLSTVQLAEKGLFRAAYSSAVYARAPALAETSGEDGDNEEIATVIKLYNRAAGTSYKPEDLPRLFGVFPMEVKRAIVL
ncbi:MAG: hypothetical protein LBK77_07475 [Spirochaetaceae bacterium]|jgi:hypothetical protein|nr:hypothetical protein [Spirochaetaceae bacterium]